jgi:ComF family protein
MLERLTNIFFPAVCPICERVQSKGERICENCKEEIVIIREPKCIKCGKPLRIEEKLYCADCDGKKHFFEKGVAVFEYSGVFRESLYRFKYDNARDYADFYGYTAAQVYGETLKAWKVQAILPVPMYHKKEIKRGYNQAQVFAKAVSRYTKIPMDEKCFVRRKATVPQKELSDEMRKENLQGAFAVNTDRLSAYKRVLLVDDIYTTGSTIDACARLLLMSGVEKVYFLCISSGKDKNE